MKVSAKFFRENVACDMVGKDQEGNFTFRRGFFYTMGLNSDMFAARIKSAVEKLCPDHDVRIVDQGEKWTGFRGGARTQNQSHWWVKIGLTSKEA